MGLFRKKIESSPKTEENKIINEIDNKNSKISAQVTKEINHISKISKGICENADEINSSLISLNYTNNIQNSEITNANLLLKELNSSIENITTNINNAHSKVLDTDKLATNGLKTISELNTSLTDLEKAFSISSTTVNALVDKLESVNSITDSISQIASQTNLLSLNAAIEAARAGEAGRGFSVVAGEVRKLAENSKQAVQSITSILEEIKQDIIDASVAMKNGNLAVETQHKTISVTKENFVNIKESIDSSSNDINECILSVSQAFNNTKEVSLSVEKVNSLVQENNALSEEICSSMNSQYDSIKNLNSTTDSIRKIL